MMITKSQWKRTLSTNIYLLLINLSLYLVYLNYITFEEPFINSWFIYLIIFTFLDFLSYCFHWLLHRFKILWYIHELHHNSCIYHPTLTFRLHIFEVILSHLSKAIILSFLGLSLIHIFHFDLHY